MKNIKLIIFDLDGTLVDAYPAIIKSFTYTMKKLNYPAQDTLAIRRAVGWGDQNLLRPFVSPDDLQKALLIYRRHHAKALLKGAALFPKAGKVLSGLKNKGYKIAVASNRPTRFSRILIRHLRIGRYLHYLLCADKLRRAKPHPQILNRIIKRFLVTPQEAIYVGDMTIDAQAGRRAGIKTIIVTTGSSTKQEIRKEKPFRVIPGIEGLLRFFP